MAKGKKEKKQRRFSLTSKLLITLFAGGAASFLLVTIGLLGWTAYLNKVYMSEDKVNERTIKHIEAFAEYVAEHDIESTDKASILAWQDEEKHVNVLVYENADIIFDSNWRRSKENIADKFIRSIAESKDFYESDAERNEEIAQVKKERNDLEDINYVVETNADASSKYTFYTVNFSDGIYDVCILDYSENKMYLRGVMIGVTLFFIITIIIVMSYYGLEIRRVVKLTNSVKKIDDDLDADISVKGSDEIYELSETINNMRKRIIDQLGKEKKAWQANSDLVTSMAHDIRTPLTVLAGYIDLIKCGDYDSPEELQQYIDISAEKTEQLRELSDKLFKYFYVYSNTEEKMHMEEYDAYELFEQIFFEYITIMEGDGYIFENNMAQGSAIVKVDPNYLQRIADNIMTNVHKYADKSKPIRISSEYTDNIILLKVQNSISHSRNAAESTKIGLKTSEKMCEQMGIKFWVDERNGLFTVYGDIPCKIKG